MANVLKTLSDIDMTTKSELVVDLFSNYERDYESEAILFKKTHRSSDVRKSLIILEDVYNNHPDISIKYKLTNFLMKLFFQLFSTFIMFIIYKDLKLITSTTDASTFWHFLSILALFGVLYTSLDYLKHIYKNDDTPETGKSYFRRRNLKLTIEILKNHA